MNRKAPRHPDVVSVAQAADLLRVNRTTVHRWIVERKLHPVMVGKTRLLWLEEVETLASQRRQVAIAILTEEALSGASIAVEVRPTADRRELAITYTAPSGSKLVGVCRFDEDPGAWLKRLAQTEEALSNQTK